MSFLINGGIPEGDLPVKAPSGASNIRYVEGGKSYSSPMPDIVNAAEQMQAAIDGIVASTEAQANALLDSLGYTPPVPYSGGISITYSNQTVEYNGNIYAPKTSDLPFTTSGTFEEAKFRLVLQGSFLQSGVGAVRRSVQEKLRERVSVKDFGAVGDGSTDDTAAIQAAFDSVLATGGTVFIPGGYYRLTAGVHVGMPEFSQYEFIASRTASLTDIDFSTYRIPANVASNAKKPGVSLEFDENAFLVADFSPASLTPVLAYHLPGEYRKDSGIVNANVISISMLTGGVYEYDSVNIPQENNLIGIYAARGCRVMNRPFVSGCEYGVMTANPFWMRIVDIRVEWAGGDCLNMAQANSCVVDSTAFWTSKRGLVFDGDASSVRSIHCQQVEREITVFRSDSSEFGPAYLEDVSGAAGSGQAVTLGETGGGLKITSCFFKGIRVGSRRPGKAAYRIWDCSSVSFISCRAYSGGVAYDATSRGLMISTDFPVDSDQKRFAFLGNGIGWPSFTLSNSTYVVQGPWMFQVNGIAPGSIPAGGSYNFDYSLPDAVTPANSATAHASYVSGGSAMLTITTRILFQTPKKVRITFSNPTASPIDPGTCNMALCVFAGF